MGRSENIQLKVNLESLAQKIARDFNLKLSIDRELEKAGFQDLQFVLEHRPNGEALSITRNYSDNALDFEELRIEHYPKEDEETRVGYISSDEKYFRRTVSEIPDTNNEFLSYLKRDLSKTLISRRGENIFYYKRVNNNQSSLEEIMRYMVAKFKGWKFSIESQSV